MYAVVATVTVDDPNSAREVLNSERVPFVKRALGLVGGYWLEPVNGMGMSVLIFETTEFAEQAAAYPLPPLPGVTPVSIEVREVFAQV